MKRSTTAELVRAGHHLANERGQNAELVGAITDRLEQFHRLACLARELQRNLRAPNRQDQIAGVMRQLAAMDVDLMGGDSKSGYVGG